MKVKLHPEYSDMTGIRHIQECTGIQNVFSLIFDAIKCFDKPYVFLSYNKKNIVYTKDTNYHFKYRTDFKNNDVIEIHDNIIKLTL